MVFFSHDACGVGPPDSAAATVVAPFSEDVRTLAVALAVALAMALAFALAAALTAREVNLL